VTCRRCISPQKVLYYSCVVLRNTIRQYHLVQKIPILPHVVKTTCLYATRSANALLVPVVVLLGTIEVYCCSRNPAKICQPPKCCDTGNFSRLLSRYFVLTCRGVIATITDKRTKKFAKNLSVHNCPLSLGGGLDPHCIYVPMLHNLSCLLM
jgi:hypothetical protein